MHRETKLLHYGRPSLPAPANPPVVRASSILHDTVESYDETIRKRASDDIKKSGFSGPVGPDQPGNSTGFDLDRSAIDSMYAAEPFVQIRYSDHGNSILLGSLGPGPGIMEGGRPLRWTVTFNS